MVSPTKSVAQCTTLKWLRSPEDGRLQRRRHLERQCLFLLLDPPRTLFVVSRSFPVVPLPFPSLSVILRQMVKICDAAPESCYSITVGSRLLLFRAKGLADIRGPENGKENDDACQLCSPCATIRKHVVCIYFPTV